MAPSWTSAAACAWLGLLAVPALAQLACPDFAALEETLVPQLACTDCVNSSTADAPRWSLYGAPKAQYLVDVESAEDVAATVKWCNANNVSFVAQNGGNGWATFVDRGECGVVINLERLNSITFDANKTEAVIGGGLRIQEMVEAAYTNGTRFANPTCNCLGYLGSTLGGGVNRAAGLYGWAVDSILSVNVVLASGDIVTADRETNADLFWAMKGAAPNFGIVTSATVKAYPVAQEQNYAWTGPLVYADNQMEAVAAAMNDLVLEPNMQIDLILGTSGAPDFIPAITVFPFFLGPEEEGLVKFKSLLDLAPVTNGVKVTPYNEWGAFSDGFCTKGGRKPAYGVSTNTMPPKTWVAVWEEYKTLVTTNPGLGYSAILSEDYSVAKAVQIGGKTSSFPWRTVPYHIVVIPWYEDPAFDLQAEAWGNRVRDLLRATDGVEGNATYINFAHGDEPLEEIYGNNTERLQVIKKKYDPKNRFNQWFPLA